ncbi:SusC/RagA family TonB-linked outer membrane protein [Cytophagaceae bacterium DM2B3-1]|uniref:SusC/RagA family TonB-linked outer membrane protein n=1 Tax=Xanthocytophaga flava TaxID=3048013 RepID=A0ABT7CGS1_9BACT|nr:SusC/RagA family TonB-linked outer membrane protein [Xanthocytophaga flavus]MDJ1492170.1 SusC/RagA family TonB-linked outer membrane protein [Xanthocytophaga flavus]
MMKKSTRLLLRVCFFLGTIQGIHGWYNTPYAQTNSDNSSKSAQIPLKSALDKVSAIYGTQFVYERSLLEGKTTGVDVEAMKKSGVEEVLKSLLYPNNLLFLYVDKNHYTIISRDNKDSSPISPSTGQNTFFSSVSEMRTVNGRVVDDLQRPVVGATIYVANTKAVAGTNSNGEFSMQVPLNGGTLLFSHIGFNAKEVPLSSATHYEVVLEMKIEELMEVEVVSTGYQNLPKERATGSFSTITAKELEKIPVPNIAQRLEGNVPGLLLNIGESDNSFLYTTTSNKLYTGVENANTSLSMALRGRNTINSNQAPLLVIDGFPSQLDIRNLNPNDIEQITVLKDAAAASIWGVRAANGVIVVTTKKGASLSAPRISFSAMSSISGKPRLSSLPLMNSSQMIDAEQELIQKRLMNDPYNMAYALPITSAAEWIFRARRGAITTDQRDSALNVLRNTNGYDQVQQYLLQKAVSQQYNLSVSGGHDGYTFYIGGSFSNERSYVVGTSGDRYTLTVNQDFKLFKKATLTTSLRTTLFDQKNNGLGLAPFAGYSATTFMPYNQLKDANGQSINYDRGYYSQVTDSYEKQGYLNWKYNYLDELRLSDNTTKDNNYSANIGLNIPVYKGITISGQYYIEKAYVKNRIFQSIETYYTRDLINTYTSVSSTGALTYGIPKGGVLTYNNYGSDNYSFRGQINYTSTFNSQHLISALAGAEVRQTWITGDGNKLYGYNDDNLLSVPVPSQTATSFQGYSVSIPSAQSVLDRRNRFLSYFANASYTLKNKYILSGSVRYDDYNNFGLDRKYRAIPLWSTGLAWNLSEENFMHKFSSWLDNLKLRATYGFNGNISLSSSPFTRITLMGTDNVTQLPYASIINPANPALRWEKTGVLNFGLDYSLFQGRLGGSFEVFYKRSTDLLADFPVNPTYLGSNISTVTRNAGSMNGHGVEIALNGVIVRSNDFQWNASFIMSYNTHKVTDSRYAVATSRLQTAGNLGALINYPVDNLFVFRWAGLDDAGKSTIYNEKGEVIKSAVYSASAIKSLNDLKYAGRITPQYFGSFNHTFKYKRLTLFVQTVYKMGYVFMKPYSPMSTSRYGGVGYSLYNTIDKRWRQAGDEATTNVPGLIQGTYGNIYYQYSDINVEKGDHIRLREVSLGYTIPERWFGRVPVKGVTITGVVRNLGILWRANKDGIDPDFIPNIGTSNLQLPPSISYGLNLNANF